MKNFKFIISYDGSRYFGWERQPGRDTIQGKLEAVLTRMCGTDVQVIGAGRTDAGVHARAMAANAYMNTEKTPEEIRDYMNRYLPDDICVQEAKLAAEVEELQRLIGNMRDYRAKLDRVIAHEKHRARGESAKIEIVNSSPFIIKEIDTNMDEAMESFPS